MGNRTGLRISPFLTTPHFSPWAMLVFAYPGREGRTVGPYYGRPLRRRPAARAADSRGRYLRASRNLRLAYGSVFPGYRNFGFAIYPRFDCNRNFNFRAPLVVAG